MSIYVDELGSLDDRGTARTAGVVRMGSTKRIRDAVLDDEMVRLLKDGKRLLKEKVSFQRTALHTVQANELTTGLYQMPENWSLLTELALAAGLSQLEGSQAACMFLYMLTG
jgi:hypothetical protein